MLTSKISPLNIVLLLYLVLDSLIYQRVSFLVCYPIELDWAWFLYVRDSWLCGLGHVWYLLSLHLYKATIVSIYHDFHPDCFHCQCPLPQWYLKTSSLWNKYFGFWTFGLVSTAWMNVHKPLPTVFSWWYAQCLFILDPRKMGVCYIRM